MLQVRTRCKHAAPRTLSPTPMMGDPLRRSNGPPSHTPHHPLTLFYTPLTLDADPLSAVSDDCFDTSNIPVDPLLAPFPAGYTYQPILRAPSGQVGCHSPHFLCIKRAVHSPLGE
jgi:hypothetical protein